MSSRAATVESTPPDIATATALLAMFAIRVGIYGTQSCYKHVTFVFVTCTVTVRPFLKKVPRGQEEKMVSFIHSDRVAISLCMLCTIVILYFVTSFCR